MSEKNHLFQAGLDSFADRDFLSAAQWFEMAVKNGQSSHNANFYLSFCLLELQEFLKAEKILEIILPQETRSIIILHNLARAKVGLQKMEEAKSILRLEVTLDQDFAPAHFLLAELLAREGSPDEAQIVFIAGKKILSLYKQKYCYSSDPH